MLANRFLLVLVALAAVVTLAGTALAGTTVRSAGPLTDLQTAVDNPTDGARARATVTEHAAGSTVTLVVRGLDPAAAGMTLGAHVHIGDCVAGNGAAALGHYYTGDGPISPQTEVWLDFEIRGDGVGRATTQVPFVIPEGGASAIVIHEHPTDSGGLAGARLACIGIEL
jgi:Cu/Zn superoxide dismutase